MVSESQKDVSGLSFGQFWSSYGKTACCLVLRGVNCLDWLFSNIKYALEQAAIYLWDYSKQMGVPGECDLFPPLIPKSLIGRYPVNVSSERCCWDRTTEHPAAAHAVSNETAWTISRKKRRAFPGNMCGVWGLQWSRTFKNTHCIFWIAGHTTFLYVNNNSAFLKFSISQDPRP